MASDPDMAIRRDSEEIAAALPPLLVAANRVTSSIAQGVHARRRVGHGEAFWQYRRFAFGDGSSDIDWRRSARSDRLYVRQTEREVAQSVWLWPDLSASMRYASHRDLPDKQYRAAILSLALASLLTRGGERIALLDRPEPPATGRAALDRIAMTLIHGMDAPPEGYDLPSVPALPRNGTVVLISDFMVDRNVLLAFLCDMAARGVHGHLLQVLDPSEAKLPFHGRTRFRGLEAEGELLVGRAESLFDGYMAGLNALQSSLATFAQRVGWSFAIHRTNAPPEPALLSLFMAMTDTQMAGG